MQKIENSYLFIFDTTDFISNKHDFDFYYKIADKKTQQKVDKLKFEQDKNLTILTPICMAKCFNFFELDIQTVSITTNKYGKPIVVSPKNIQYNISHSKNKILIAISPTDIGCDIEFIDYNDYDNNMMLVNNFFIKNEIKAINNNKFDLSTKTDCFYKIWTTKESYFKAIGTGLSSDLSECEVSINQNEIAIKIQDKLNNFNFKTFKQDDYQISVCYRTQNIEIVKNVM